MYSKFEEYSEKVILMKNVLKVFGVNVISDEIF